MRLLKLQYRLFRLVRRYVNPPYSCVAAVIICQDQVLLVRHTYRNKERWETPGGHKLFFESPRRAIEREMRQELNLRQWLGIYYLGCNEIGNPRVHLFAILVSDPHLRPRGKEIAECDWFARRQLPASTAQGSRRAIRTCPEYAAQTPLPA